MVEISTVIVIAIVLAIVAIIGINIYNRRFAGRIPFRREKQPYRRTPEGEPLEYEGQKSSLSPLRIAVPALIVIVLVGIILSSSFKIVEA